MSMLPFSSLPATPRPFPIPDNASTRAWRRSVEVLTAQGAMTERKARIFIGGLVKQGLKPEDLQSIADGAHKAGTLDPMGYFVKATHDALKRRKTVTAVEAPSEARMRAWMAEWRENPAAWRRDIRGPAPGEPGCCVPMTIQQEAGDR